ncbi:hypothetical protein DOTSEDRAFT_70606 [Dothistroma septosporum NZE10]|uniref:BHLH domain-containing protein n=1 Tax=Dothistroma septosporum (strain NZE10 / CBS 128990) TaxID=675120 RepID=N1PTE9_DOTSN|nr:hypothetical protein DOTSEDRAFT_70606 [Dothistroma septosporum NZE10]
MEQQRSESPDTPAKARLTEAAKKANHIQSEKKRRLHIRAGFDRLADIVPEMKGQGRSEAIVLQHTVEHVKAQQLKKEQIKAICLQRGWSAAAVEDIYRQHEEKVRAQDAERAEALQREMEAQGLGP